MKVDMRQLFDAKPTPSLYVAINRLLVGNDPDLMSMMKQARSRICLGTALTPGFKGFDLLYIHGPKVLDNCLQLPNVRMADSMSRFFTY